MHAHDETIWWMTNDGRMFVGSVPPAGNGYMANGTVKIETRCGVIATFRGEPATLAKLPRELLDELTDHFPGVRWWVHDATLATQHNSAKKTL